MQIIGDIALLKFLKPTKHSEKKNMAVQLKKTMPNIKTVLEFRNIEGEFRVPAVRRLLGKETVTIHREHGILYKLDTSKIMFSKGNVLERKRTAMLTCGNEKILDMFAGIGYFSLGIAKSNPNADIVACEKNPAAFQYLEENITLNKTENIKPLLKDCRFLHFPQCFDRIIMGYLPGTEKFLPSALKMIKPGGVIHYHNIYAEHELWTKAHAEIESACTAASLTPRILEQRKVKSYAPCVSHVVIDFEVNRK